MILLNLKFVVLMLISFRIDLNRPILLRSISFQLAHKPPAWEGYFTWSQAEEVKSFLVPTFVTHFKYPEITE